VSNSTIRNNYASDYGGGIYNEPLGIVTVSYSKISGNQAHFGGGIYNTATLIVGNSIIKHNKAFGIELSSGSYESGHGGGIYNSKSGTATLDYTTIICNFDTPQEDSTKVIKLDNLVGKFITKCSSVKV
ncbi:right-handed parallel beta-helix repeat-containing protein, partial [uncultured Nostoc sp.]|uniref:right-handed parallel beta-helix repeat-containing protein n=1 Tax=uncultured Nostoc sp. TaxID=340711 RepID=UPI0035C9E484